MHGVCRGSGGSVGGQISVGTNGTCAFETGYTIDENGDKSSAICNAAWTRFKRAWQAPRALLTVCGGF